MTGRILHPVAPDSHRLFAGISHANRELRKPHHMGEHLAGKRIRQAPQHDRESAFSESLIADQGRTAKKCWAQLLQRSIKAIHAVQISSMSAVSGLSDT